MPGAGQDKQVTGWSHADADGAHGDPDGLCGLGVRWHELAALPVLSGSCGRGQDTTMVQAVPFQRDPAHRGEASLKWPAEVRDNDA
jgi:hypothetical protein